ncbi:cyclase family protein [Desulfonatronospira sp. MSAO_Bac3]|uniref:cyclase family protein n=1 Tax=Desulfonatronospira sp. MSAO_Bac3 TaxID=2293857 RepID=UPI000FF87030|nr:cyclase family protein [Desulfonatronospira sp. MSAO_Bac3]RQD76965.1 MAG: cyclase family protein [Desulfonatronospira sp. MSAO_Bac3]
MNNWIFLSYPLNPQAPAYGGGHGFAEKKVKQMDQGDSCDTKSWSMSNHIGTHIDFPRHFSTRGKDIDDYDPEFFIFFQVFIADISPAEPELIITPDHLDISQAPADTDLLLIRTGFGGLRGRDTYSQNNPGFHPDLADYLRERLPALRALGVDSISLSSYAHRDLGREAHRAFLLDSNHPILPLEDMHLEQIDGQIEIEQVIIAPLRVTGADGAPCTVLAKVKGR